MAKKKTSKPDPVTEDSNKITTTIRFDRDVLEGLRKLADKAGVSVNQLLNSLAGFAVEHGGVGEPVVYRYKGKEVFEEVKKMPGVLYFGRQARRWRDGECEAYEEDIRDKSGDDEFKVEDRVFADRGNYYFMFDYTVRRLIREE